MSRFAVIAVGLSLFLLPIWTAAAGPPSSGDLTASVQKLQQFYRSLTSLQCRFEQISSAGGRERQGDGEAVFYRPCAARKDTVQTSACRSILRWTYNHPEPQIILNDGETLSIFNQVDNQLLIIPGEDLGSDISYGLLSGSKDLLDDFAPYPPAPPFLQYTPGPASQGIRLVPRQDHPQIQSIHIWFDNNLLLQRLVLEDHFGSITMLSFSHIQLNGLPAGDSAIQKKLLSLPLREDTEIIQR